MSDLSSMASATRIQRLIDEFEDAADGWGNKYNIRHGIAAVLRHLADALDAPTLLERAMKGDASAAKQFLYEAGFTDEQGQWLPQYQPIP